MYLSKKQIEEIAQQIASISKKDSDFEETFELNGEDYVAIVQDGVNKKISGDLFRSELQKAARDAVTATLATNTAVQNAEALRVTAEQGRVSAESARADAEALRASAELTRENNETARGNAESVRVSAESGRVTAENGRVSAESARVTAESERASAETSRRSEFESLESDMQTAIGQADAATAAAVALNEEVAGDEADRVAAETARETAESGRVSAESARVTAESGRVTAESGRVSAEQARVGAESSRASAETARASAETARAGAETSRASAETSRVNAETAREAKAAADHTRAESDHEASNALQQNLENGNVVPKLAENLESWESRDALSVSDTFTDAARTTAGDTSIVSGAGAKVVSVVAKTNFYASALRATGFNLLHGATAVGAGFYFLVPALPFGTFGTALKPNGVLFTDNNGGRLTPTVRFKALSSGVPTSVSDGSECPYTDSNGYRFYNPAAVGYLIVSGITLANTCAHVAWSRRYDEFISPSEASDAGASITLSSIIHVIHAYDLMLVVGTIADRIDFGTSAATWTRRVDRATPTWTDTDNGDGTYIHTATISGMAPGGAAEFMTANIILSVDGTSVSYTDENATASADYVKYELATQATGTVTISPSLAIEDWGLEVLESVSGSAYITMQYAQGFPDSLAALVAGVNNAKLQVLVEALASLDDRIEALELRAGKPGNAAFGALDAIDYTRYGVPFVLEATVAPAADTVPDNWPSGMPWDGIPAFPGQIYINRASGGKIYMANGIAAISNWIALN